MTTPPTLSLRGRWRTVASRSYGTRVYRVEGRSTLYVKTTPPRRADDFRFNPSNEAARLGWLQERGFPVPEVIEVGASDEQSWMVMTEVPGIPADTAPDRARAIATVAEFTRSLHALRDCPFDGSLSVTTDWARRAVASGVVDLDDLDPEHDGWSGHRLLEKLSGLPVPPEDLVVCHGDLGLDNVLIDPSTYELTGVIDVGRLGLADPWRDLAVLVRDAGRSVLEVYGVGFDAERERYYRLLDEFF
ncbi:aminoglycoside 3'-phosphotransferase [Actinokineospora cianjurensis]|uniref:Kanamycin kinase/aminoglycoside 3'-phosphotransferase-2 n=1 Tax=Actinokineospora cianjurensis TaxID=585224 RepID=A0A421B1P8_9PSEU|nr:aminoglycoside 3'-phosphotransferase [Actinokineospora cianjurensis]RLK58206.1 kanamycin kinase/aminoglycoside 3'-phosphotransferase-2 [Actinokineospora cianjurensis]